MKRVFVVLGAIAAVALLIGAAFVVTTGDDTIQGQVTVYIEPTDSSTKMMAAQMSLGAVSGTEALMLSAGQGIRTAAFTPNYTQNIGPLSRTATYRIWASASIKVAGPEVASIALSDVWFRGYASSGSYDLWYTEQPLKTAGGSTFIYFQNQLKVDQAVALSTSSAKWSQVYAVIDMDQRGNLIHDTVPLQGVFLDGAVISISVYARCNLNNGDVVDKVKAVTLQLKVTSWTTAQVSLSMIDDSAPTPSVIEPMMKTALRVEV